MKGLSYILVAVLGAAAASWATWRLVAPGTEGRGPAPTVAVVGVPPPAPVAEGLVYASVERLAREKADQAVELEVLRARLAVVDGELKRTRENLDELRRPMTGELLSSALRAELKSGEVVVTGGYALPDGTRVYAFVQPRIERVDGEERVRVSSTFRTLADEVGSAVGLDTVATNVGNTLQHGEVWLEDEQREVFSALDAGSVGGRVPGPELVLGLGESAWVEAGPLRLKITPRRGARPEELDFEVRLEQTPPPQAGAGEGG